MENKIFYFGLEPLKERYTYQLSKQWMPHTFQEMCPSYEFIDVEGETVANEIKVGCVLDAVGRSVYSLSQCSNFIKMIGEGLVNNGDVIFLQDFWTPGIEGVFYTLDLYGIDVKVYSMLHAQSVDEYDFTYKMKEWMRDYELGLDKRSNGIFVGSTIHKEQLRQAGFKAPIQVVSLPFHKEKAIEDLFEDGYLNIPKKENKVIFSSRLDKEKNPYFLLEVIKSFLFSNENYTFVITTSGNKIKSNLSDMGVLEEFYKLQKRQPRFKILENLTKAEYYKELSTSKVIFNSSLQDYVSWTSIEAVTFGCKLCTPNFRSFPDFVSKGNMYMPFDVSNAVDTLFNVLNDYTSDTKQYKLPDISDLGRQFEGYIINNNITDEYNIWHEYELIQNKVQQFKNLKANG